MPDLIDRLTGRRSLWEPLPQDSELAQFFTDAEAALQVFQELVTAEKLLRRLLIIHGVGGIGKSSLLRMYRLSCYQQGVPVGLVGAEDAPSALDVLAAWAADLAGLRLNLRTFEKGMDEYRALRAKVEAKASEVLKGAAGEAGKIAAKTAVEMAASAIPIVGPFAAALGGAGTEAAVDWLRGILKRPELELYLDPLERLTNSFLKDLDRVATRQRTVLMVDTYEQMTGLDAWMRDLAQQLPDNLLLVISGRAIPEWDRAWPGWLGKASIIELEEMTLDDQRVLVRRYYGYIRGGEPDPAQVEAIVEFSRGLPIAVTTVVRLWVKHGVEDFHAVKPQVVADLTDRLLEGVPQEMRPAFETAAVLRYFNVDSLAAMLDRGGADALYAELQHWPFVYPRREGLAVHDAMREMMNEALGIRTPLRFRVLHERAAGYYDARRLETTAKERESATLELLYHSLQADENKGIDLLETLFEEARRLWQRAFQVNILEEASRHRFKEAHNHHSLQYLQARMGSDWPEREQLYRELLSEDLDATTHAAALRDLGVVLALQGKKDEARHCLQQALEINEQAGDHVEAAWTRLELFWRIKDADERLDLVNRAIEAFSRAGDQYGIAIAELQLGHVYLDRWQAGQARDAFARSLDLQEQLGLYGSAAKVRERIGQTYLIEGDFQKAIVFKEEALEVMEKLRNDWNIAWALDELATCYIWTGQWEQGLEATKRASEISAVLGDSRETASIARQGEFYRRQGRFDKALEVYQKAANMPEHNVWSTYNIYAGRGYVHLARNEFKEALADFDRARNAFKEEGKDFEARLVVSYDFGNVYLAQGRWNEAIEQFAECLDAARSRGHYAFECLSLLRLCQARYQQGHPEQVEVLAGEAEGLARKYVYHKQLTDIYLLRGHIALDGVGAGAASLETAIGFYRTALRHALSYNRFKLDETVERIINHCQEQAQGGHQVLAALRAFWQTGTDDQGVPLLDAERAARERELGDGEPQVAVVQRLDGMLEEAPTPKGSEGEA